MKKKEEGGGGEGKGGGEERRSLRCLLKDSKSCRTTQASRFTSKKMGGSSVVLASLLVFISATTTVSAAHCFFLKELAIIGGTYDEFEANDIRQCCIKCAQQSCCMAYTFDKIKRRCYMKSAIGFTEERSYTTSGLKANIANGNGCKLTNVEIVGGSTHLSLKNSKECQEFCTAYGIYTWLPAGLNEDNEHVDATCTCTNRIASLRTIRGAQDGDVV